MILKIFLICMIVPFIKALSVNNNKNDVSSHDEQIALFGPDRFCYFAYYKRAKPSVIHQFYPNAISIGVARLPYHRLDFKYYLEEVKGNIPTTVPDCGYEVWGAIYTMPIQDFDLLISRGSFAGSERVFHLEQKIIETYSEGRVINLKCNLFQQIDLPEKLIYGLPLPEDRRPARQTLDMMIDAYKDARLPPEYIRQVSMIPTRDQNIVESNLDRNSQQNQNPVIVAPNSLVVAPDSTVVTQNTDTSTNDD